MTTKNESELIELREKRFKKLSVWNPSSEEFIRLVIVQWERVLAEIIDADKVRQNAAIRVAEYKASKFYDGMAYIYGEFVGKSRNPSIILIYKLDILQVNLFQKDLVTEHIYYILKHELAHYLGVSHEDMEQLKFVYPGVK